jgi:hypothetical protein
MNAQAGFSRLVGSGFGSLGVCALALAMAGCAGSAASGIRAPLAEGMASETAPVGAPPPPAAAAPDFAASAPMPPSSPPTPSRSETAERVPSQRPGLGTEWGETRFSQVHEEPFTRAGDPFALATVRYDDRSGVDAMAAHHGGVAQAYPIGELSFADGGISMVGRGEDGGRLETLRLGDRTYVVGRAGERYTIVLANRSNRRFEAVATVDGLDVINGKSGKLSNRGYLLDPYANLEIDGFRQSDDTVAAFRFGRVADSYAAKSGSARDVGVIGVAFFAERGASLHDEEARLRERATPFPSDSRYAQPPL